MLDRIFKKNRAQAALEFLTTYAWAFLVILIMIGALAYFGVLQPSQILPDRCTFGSEISCQDYSISGGNPTTAGDGSLNVRLRNNVGEPIVIPAVETDITLETEATTAFSCGSRDIDGQATGSYTWGTNEIIDMSFTSCNTEAVGFIQGDKGKVSVTIEYHSAKSSATYTRQVQGEVFATVT